MICPHRQGDYTTPSAFPVSAGNPSHMGQPLRSPGLDRMNGNKRRLPGARHQLPHAADLFTAPIDDSLAGAFSEGDAEVDASGPGSTCGPALGRRAEHHRLKGGFSRQGLTSKSVARNVKLTSAVQIFALGLGLLCVAGGVGLRGAARRNVLRIDRGRGPSEMRGAVIQSLPSPETRDGSLRLARRRGGYLESPLHALDFRSIRCSVLGDQSAGPADQSRQPTGAFFTTASCSDMSAMAKFLKWPRTTPPRASSFTRSSRSLPPRPSFNASPRASAAI